MRRKLGIRCALAATVLALAACGQTPTTEDVAEAPATEEAGETPGGTTDAALEPAYPICPEIQRRVPPQECEDFTQLARQAEAGVAAFNAPDPMQRGEAHTLQLAISFAPTPEEIAAREAVERARAEAEERVDSMTAEQAPTASVDSGALAQRDGEPVPPDAAAEPQPPPPAPPPPLPPTPEEVVDPLQGETVQYEPLVGRFMRAELTGTGFEITALSEASQEVLPQSVTTWNWRVVAREGGRRTLTLRTVVEGCNADRSQCYPLRSTSQNYDVTVQVGPIGQVRDFLMAAPDWLRLVAGVLTALAVLIGAWFGLRNAFRKGATQ